MLGTAPLRTLKDKTFPGLLLCAAALIGTVGPGCADECFAGFMISRSDDHKLALHRCGDTQPGGSVGPDTGIDTGVLEAGAPDVPAPPSGAVVTSVAANGTGCPAGTATSTIARDGQSFTVAFTQFTVSVDENTLVGVKDCQLTISVSVPEGVSYALQSLNLKGTGTIGEGADLRVSTDYWFMGNPVGGAKQETTLTGPYDQALDVTHAYDGVWSPCGRERDLQVSMTARLQNGEPGTASTATVNSAGDLAFRLQPCQ